MELLLHFLLPLAGLHVFFPSLDRRKVLRLSFLSVAPDLDYVLGHVLFHNVFFLFFFAYCVYYFSGRDGETTFIAVFYWVSHLILDLQFVALFWPLYRGFVSVHADVYVNPAVSQVLPSMLFGRNPATVNSTTIFKHRITASGIPYSLVSMGDESPLLTSFGLIVFLYAVFSLTVSHISRKKGFKP